jgi:hypothetical protein
MHNIHICPTPIRSSIVVLQNMYSRYKIHVGCLLLLYLHAQAAAFLALLSVVCATTVGDSYNIL